MESFNKKSIEKFNIFDHGRFFEDVKKALKENQNKEEFAKEIRKCLIYYFWSKCEYEVVITSWVPRITKDELDRLNEDFKKSVDNGYEPYSLCVSPEVRKKIDIYDQVMLNFDKFVDYIWSFRSKSKHIDSNQNNKQTSLFDIEYEAQWRQK